MPSEAKPTITPKLRFPEFRDKPGWKEKSIREAVSAVVREKKKPTVNYTGLGVRSHGKGTFKKDNENPEKNSMDYLYEVKRDDLIVNITFAWEGAVAIAKREDEGALVSHRFPTYKFERDVAIPEFFQYIIPTKKFVYDLGVISPGGAGRNRVLNKSDFLKLTTFLPEVHEQKKIAECLSMLDELIGAESQKLDALQAHKRGLMQQLFPREGETVPRLRFPEFQNTTEWALESFETLYEFQPTSTFSRNQLNYEKGTVKNIHYGDIHTKFAAEFCIERENVPFVNPEELPDHIKVAAYCKEGDMVFADSSEDLTDVGKSIEIVNLNGEMVLSGSHTILARLRDDDLITGFGAHLFRSRNVRAQIEKEAHGTKVESISPSRLARVKICFPRNKAEQEKIANSFSFLYDLIAAQSAKLEALKTHKKGLMQELFPCPTQAES